MFLIIANNTDESNSLILVCSIVFVVTFILVLLKFSIEHDEKVKKQRKDSIDNKFSSLCFTPTSRYDEKRGGFSIGIDEVSRKILIAFTDHHHLLDFDDILSAEVVVDGSSSIKSSTSQVVGRTIVGGVVGGITADRHIVSSQHDVHVNVNMRRFDIPPVKISILDRKVENPGTYYTDIANEVANLFRAVVDRVENDRRAMLADKIASPPVEYKFDDNENLGAALSVADELRKLADLRAQGILTDAEFDDQKHKLLNN